MSGDQLAAS